MQSFTHAYEGEKRKERGGGFDKSTCMNALDLPVETSVDGHETTLPFGWCLKKGYLCLASPCGCTCFLPFVLSPVGDVTVYIRVALLLSHVLRHPLHLFHLFLHIYSILENHRTHSPHAAQGLVDAGRTSLPPLSVLL
uniref:Uncharacterized protein n=1 Tax=Trypanosoma congolense (strain IL3000) TaxID=1068625 RepID=G0UTE9_TRYCI|nr:hypothetical protein, unlikely [Trypanosoma congolense IL3000]